MTHYEKNEMLLNSPINVVFDDMLRMTNEEFEKWVIDMRKTVVELWDNHGQPPRRGKWDVRRRGNEYNFSCD